MTTKYQIWLTNNAEKEKIQLPVLPESFKILNSCKNESVDISGLGEITILQSRAALQFSFSSFFPAKAFPGIQVKKITSPKKLVEKIHKWVERKKPIHFISTAFGINMYCSIESFQAEENGGDVGSYKYSITLKEYRDIAVRQIKIDVSKQKALVSKGKKRVNNSSKPKTYTVKSGDCLWNIAKRFYGDGAKYTKIYNANKKVIGGNPNRIFVGQVLEIP